MKILLSYSYYHFDPDKPLDKQPDRNTSAGILARTFYEILSEFGDTTYTDASRYKEHLDKEFDLFVGIASHFQDILKTNRIKIKKSILIAVNMHPLERNRILNNAVKELRLPEAAVDERDIVNPEPYLEAIEMADFILCAGNMATYNSYIRHGVPLAKIKTFNYGLLDPAKGPPRSGPKRRLVYAASEVGLRKGFDLLYETVTNPKIKELDFHLDIIGPASTTYHEKKLSKLKGTLGAKVNLHGWINSNSKTYNDLMDKSDFLVFPSLEEGQAGTVIDAVARGVVPIVSQNSGIDFSPLGNFEISGADRHQKNTELIINALKLSNKEIAGLKSKTKEFYQEYHADFVQPLRESLDTVINNDGYPLVSFVLAIHNKAETIGGLVEHLDKAMRNYPQTELHVIFDGCTDDSEKIVREFYADVDPSYEITYEITPNVFEVETNNLGLRKSKGKYCVIIQDDNYIYDQDFLYEAVNFLDKDPTAVVLGGLAGVNFYPLGTQLKGRGQIAMGQYEVYWRQDAATDPELKKRIFQVDACMRGPLILRKSFLEEHGYLDELYKPIHDDDMDLCLRANALGYKVYCMLMDVENKMQSVSKITNPEKSEFFAYMMTRNAKIMYARWLPDANKDYLWMNRIPIKSSQTRQPHGVAK